MSESEFKEVVKPGPDRDKLNRDSERAELLEDLLDLFTPTRPDAVKWLQGILKAEHAKLMDGLRERIGDRTLQPEPGDDKGWEAVE